MRTMKNLWEETEEALKENGVSWKDVIAVQGNDFQITKENFENLAKEVYYDCGYGAAVIASDLTILGDSWWLTRGEYDGSEWWAFNQKPQPQKKIETVKTLTAHFGWETLFNCNH